MGTFSSRNGTQKEIFVRAASGVLRNIDHNKIL